MSRVIDRLKISKIMVYTSISCFMVSVLSSLNDIANQTPIPREDLSIILFIIYILYVVGKILNDATDGNV